MSDVRHESCSGPDYTGLRILTATVPCYFYFNLIHFSKCFGSVQQVLGFVAKMCYQPGIIHILYCLISSYKIKYNVSGSGFCFCGHAAVCIYNSGSIRKSHSGDRELSFHIDTSVRLHSCESNYFILVGNTWRLLLLEKQCDIQ
jgi:hypothetical protein